MNTTTDFMAIENEVRAVASAFGIRQLWLMTNGEIQFYDRERHLKAKPVPQRGLGRSRLRITNPKP